MASTALAHYSVYVIAICCRSRARTIRWPALETNVLAGGTCTAVIDLIERFGRVHGAAFPIGTRGRLNGGDSRVVALPAVALLGLLAVLREHVHFDRVRPLPLYGGRPRRHRRRHHGIFGGNVAHAAKRSLAGNESAKLKPLRAGVSSIPGGARATRWLLRRRARSRAAALRPNAGRSVAFPPASPRA